MKTVANFSPGPSQLYFTCEDHVRAAFREGIPSMSHRNKRFEEIVADLKDGLRQITGLPDDFAVYFTASATETWERVIQNGVAETSHHFVNGAFSKRFCEISKQLGKRASQTTVGYGEGFSGLPVKTDAELIGLTHNETSTGVMTPLSWMEHVRSENPHALIAVDAVSSMPYPKLPYPLFDSVFFSVQKGFGMPAGLGVWLVNPRSHDKAAELQRKGIQIGTYHNLPTYYQNGVKNQTPETPNVLGIYVLSRIIRDLQQRGMQTIRQETDYKAALLYQVLDQHPLVSALVQDKAWRSQTVVVAHTGEHTQKLTAWLQEKGLQAGEGYGELKKTQLRFANFPAHSKEQFELLADSIQAFKG